MERSMEQVEHSAKGAMPWELCLHLVATKGIYLLEKARLSVLRRAFGHIHRRFVSKSLSKFTEQNFPN